MIAIHILLVFISLTEKWREGDDRSNQYELIGQGTRERHDIEGYYEVRDKGPER